MYISVYLERDCRSWPYFIYQIMFFAVLNNALYCAGFMPQTGNYMRENTCVVYYCEESSLGHIISGSNGHDLFT